MKIVKITGVAGGFGRPMARVFLENGYQVAGSLRSRAGKNADAVAAVEAAPDQRPERIAEAVVAIPEKPFGQKPFRTVDIGVGPQIERCNDVLHDAMRSVMTNFGLEVMFKLNA